MLQIPVCQSSLVSRTFSVHIRIWMFTLCTMHLVSTSTSEPRKEVLGNLYNSFTQKHFYTQTLLHTDATLLHTDAFTHRRFYTQKLLHRDGFTHRRFYTQIRFTHAHTLSHTNAFTHRRVDTQTLLHRTLLHADAFYTRTHAFKHKRFYTQTLLHTDTCTETKASIAIFPQFLTSNVHFVRKRYD